MRTFRWLGPAVPAAVALLRCDPVPELLQGAVPGPGRAGLRRLCDRDGATVDEVLLQVRADGTWDLGCHGGPAVRRAVTAVLLAAGLTEGDRPGGAWQDLATACCPAACRWLLRHGSASPPFPARFLAAPAQILLTGPSNAGKSTLLNAWCGHRRALVDHQAGTTRDLLAAEILIAGWRCRIFDSAGLRDQAGPLERAGQELALRMRERVDLVIHLLPPDEGTTSRSGDLVLLGKADRRPPGIGLRWAAPAFVGEAVAAGMLQRLGEAVLQRLGLA